MAFTDEQRRNAAVIAQVGRSMGASDRDIQIGLMTALQESGLRNLTYGDRDSQGLFQQRPSQGWGTVAQVTNPEYASKKFFSALLGVKGREGMALTQAAQKVQRSAFPTAYAKHESAAASLLSQLGGAAPAPGPSVSGGGSAPAVDAALAVPQAPSMRVEDKAPEVQVTGDMGLAQGSSDSVKVKGLGEGAAEVTTPFQSLMLPTYTPEQYQEPAVPLTKGATTTSTSVPAGGAPASGAAGSLVAEAKKWVGTPYVWGGSGPLGFDCSGFTQYVMRKFGVELPRISNQQGQAGRAVNAADVQPGDLVFWDNSSRNNGADHVGIAIGGGMFIDAPKPGSSVGIRKLSGNFWARRVL